MDDEKKGMVIEETPKRSNELLYRLPFPGSTLGF